MDIRNMDASNGLNNDDWTFLIFLLLMQDLNNKNETWDQFEQDLIYKNRFSSESPIVEELRKRSEQATRYIPNKAVFYRARSFKHKVLYQEMQVHIQAGVKIKNGYISTRIYSFLDLLAFHLSIMG